MRFAAVVVDTLVLFGVLILVMTVYVAVLASQGKVDPNDPAAAQEVSRQIAASGTQVDLLFFAALFVVLRDPRGHLQRQRRQAGVRHARGDARRLPRHGAGRGGPQPRAHPGGACSCTSPPAISCLREPAAPAAGRPRGAHGRRSADAPRPWRSARRRRRRSAHPAALPARRQLPARRLPYRRPRPRAPPGHSPRRSRRPRRRPLRTRRSRASRRRRSPRAERTSPTCTSPSASSPPAPTSRPAATRRST